ncbi:glycosyltransferase [Sphingomonas sp. BGYR3]|uniref:glycosyltransferase family 2 protein n=1 Tax=Sphingomonas sp. BGYR3 TaxID=2975483 RepID=UPI0021A3C35E|nr:glycosyltransferase [Sphingomonas sp. BGYR3]MDG5489264.1 glycosyltransferase [Sphingomonas sp. BGYR3]
MDGIEPVTARHGADIAVVIPCYNGARFCGQAIESALAQRDVTVEVIFVDDGSSDGSHAVADGFDGVTVIRQANGGVSKARNTGLAAVTAPYVLFLDSDDILLPDAAGLGIRHLGNDPESVIAFGGTNDIDSSGKVLSTRLPPARRFALEDVFFNTIPRPSQTVMRTDAVRRAGGFEVGRRMCEDFELYVRMLADGATGLCHGEPVAHYRRHPGQATHHVSEMMWAALDVVDRAEQAKIGGIGTARWAAIRRFWKQELGGFIAYELARAIAGRQWARAAKAARSYLVSQPYAGIGTFRAAFGLRN